MSYLALARKYRPHSFNSVVGQSAVVKALSNALDKQFLHHAYLFTGTRGVGKTSLARIFAKCLNCEQGVSSKPCGTCDHCLEIDAGNYIDLFEIDAASRTKVEDTRDLLDKIPYAPSKGRYKVYLIDEVHMLSTHSFNALLKTLEEPPKHVIFILATTELDKLPATILSRCLQFHLLHLQQDEIAGQLKHVLEQQNITFEDDAVNLIADAAEGSMRDALSLLDQALAFSGDNHLSALPLHQLYGTTPFKTIEAIWQAMVEQNFTFIIDQSKSLAQSNADFIKIINQLTQHTYQLVLNTKDEDTLKKYHQLYQHLIDGKDMVLKAPNYRIGFEMALLKAAAFYNSTNQVTNNEPQINTVSVTNHVQAATPEKKVVTPTAKPEPTISAPSLPITDWADTIQKINLTSATKLLATNCNIVSQNEEKIILGISTKHKALINIQLIKKIEQALSEHYQKPLRVNIQAKEEVVDTPHHKIEAQKNSAQEALTAQFQQDPTVQALTEKFGATIQSVQPNEA